MPGRRRAGAGLARQTRRAMAISMRRIAFAFPLVLTLAMLADGCTAPQGGYPSLAISPAERAYWQAKPATPAPAPEQTPIPPGASVTQRLAMLTANARSAHQQFLARKPQADRLTAAAQTAAMGGEAWSVAQVALAGLESARNSTSVQLTDIDSMLVAAQMASASAPSPELAPVRAAHDEVSALVEEESATVRAFAARLAG